MHSNIEITAPVGSYESLAAAIQSGANSIYFGAGKLNMRAKSSFNFSLDDLKEIVRIAKCKCINTYLTLNTVVFDNDYDEMRNIAKAAKDACVSALIVSDVAAINIGQEFGLSLYASTQLNISNIESVQFFAQFFDVMVLARELRLEQVKYITNEIRNRNITGPSGNLVKIEIFAHGALCMAISGKCYLSLHLQDHSANRGECLQPCRRKYDVTEQEKGYSLEVDNEYIMSPKDLSTIGFLDKIVDAGVSILKIEGRGRPPEYVKRTVESYKEALAAIADGSYNEEKINVWNTRLAEVFNRGFWDGYYLGKTIGEWNNRHGSSATKKKVYVGYVTNYYSKVNAAAIIIQSDKLSIGDRIVIIGNKTGVCETIVNELRIEEKNVHTAEKGAVCSIPIDSKLRPGDKIYKFVESDN